MSVSTKPSTRNTYLKRFIIHKKNMSLKHSLIETSRPFPYCVQDYFLILYGLSTRSICVLTQSNDFGITTKYRKFISSSISETCVYLRGVIQFFHFKHYYRGCFKHWWTLLISSTSNRVISIMSRK